MRSKVNWKVIIAFIIFAFLWGKIETINTLADDSEDNISNDKYSNNEDNDKCEELIRRLIESVNDKDIDEYINLFTPEEQVRMNDYISCWGRDAFFLEESRELLSLEIKESYDFVDEMTEYDDVIVYKVKENINYTNKRNRTTCDLVCGENIHDYVLVKSNGEWAISRISATDRQIPSRSLSEPIEIFVYFFDPVNTDFYGLNTTAGVYFNDYIKDVLPNEWIISYYANYPALLYAGAMASKMYGWYYAVNPKHDSAPYYACVFDTDTDQTYRIGSYSGMATLYKGYEDSILSFISNKALVSSATNYIFEVHYYENTGSYHSGKLNAAGAFSLAQSGYTYNNILHYYYDCSSYIGSSNYAVITTY